MNTITGAAPASDGVHWLHGSLKKMELICRTAVEAKDAKLGIEILNEVNARCDHNNRTRTGRGASSPAVELVIENEEVGAGSTRANSGFKRRFDNRFVVDIEGSVQEHWHPA
jgi:hypothetical protein